MKKIVDVNVLNEDAEAVLFLQHTEDQKLLVSVRNTSDQPLTVGPPAAGDTLSAKELKGKGGEILVANGSRPTDHPSDFKILFRPGILVRPENVTLTNVTHITIDKPSKTLKTIDVDVKLTNVTPVTTDNSIKTLNVDDKDNWILIKEAPKLVGKSILDPPHPAVFPLLSGPSEFVILPLARKTSLTLNVGEALVFELSKINPDVSDGTRVTRVETKFDLRSGNVQRTPLQGSALNQLALVNVGRQAFEQALQVHTLTAVKAGPLVAAFIGSNKVINDGESLNGLKIRVLINSDLVPGGVLRLKQESTIELIIDPWTHACPFGLILENTPIDFEVQEGNNPAVPTKDNKRVWKSAPGRSTTTTTPTTPPVVTPAVVTAERKDEGDAVWEEGSFLDFNLGLLSSAPAGFAPLKIAWSNLPGFKDGQLVLLAELGPTFVEEDDSPPKTKGLGTGSPLRLRGRNAHIEMFATSLVKNLPDTITGTRRDFSRVVKKNPAGLPASPDVTLSVADAGNGLVIQTEQTQITGALRVDGRVGVGTSTPTTRFQLGAGQGGGKLSIFSNDSDFGQLQIGSNSEEGAEASMCFITGVKAFGKPPQTEATGHAWSIGTGLFGLARRFVIGYGKLDSEFFGPKLTIQPEGNVGIGNTEPTTKVQVGAGELGGKVSIFSDDDNFGQLQIGNPNSGDGDEASMCFFTGVSDFGSNPGTSDTGHGWGIGTGLFGMAGRFVIGYAKGKGNAGPKFTIDPSGQISIGPQLTIDPSGQVGIGISRPEERLHVLGNIRAEGAITGRGFVGQRADLAENYYSDHDLAAGDVVCIDRDQDRIVMSEQSNDNLVIGVISTAPGVLLNSEPDAQPPQPGLLPYPVALSGRVPCKVTDENGPIRRGDLLTSSSTKGHAMKATPIDVAGQSIYRQGTMIGKALQPFNSDKGVIDIFVCLR